MTVSFSKGKATETSIRHNNRSLDLDHFDQALAEEGYQGNSKNSGAIFRAFQHHEAERLTAIAAQFGIEREPGLTNQFKNVHEYKQAMRAVEQVQKQAQLQKSKNAEVDVTLTDKEVLVQQLDQQTIKQQQQQIQKFEKFAKTIVTAIHKCKPLLKDTWNQVIERIGQHFRQDQHPDFDPFKQEWPQKDYQQLTTPSQTKLRQRYLEQQSDLEDDWELEC